MNCSTELESTHPKRKNKGSCRNKPEDKGQQKVRKKLKVSLEMIKWTCQKEGILFVDKLQLTLRKVKSWCGSLYGCGSSILPKEKIT